jgi:hypothetical protein
MHGSELREGLRSSEMNYSLKITRVLKGVSEQPCQPGRSLDGKELKGCKTQRRLYDEKGETSADWDYGDDQWCFLNCVHPIDVSLLSERQIKIYLSNRPPEKQRKDYENHPENEPLYNSIPELRNTILGLVLVH